MNDFYKLHRDEGRSEQEESGDSLYLQQLKYTKKAGKTFLNFFIQNFRVIVLLVMSVLLWGIISFSMLPLESNPEVKIPYGIVTVALPGASPADMEELVIKKVESRVVNLSGVKQVSSTALNSFASISVEFRAEEDLKDAIRRLRDAVENAKADLPAEASDPVVNEVSFSNIPVWTLVVTGPYDSFTLRKYAEMVQDELEKLEGASEVLISGGDVFEIQILYDPQKLADYGLSADTVNGIIRANNIALPLGTLDVSNFEYTVRTDGKIFSVTDLRSLPITNVNGQIVRLQDIATVLEKARKRTAFTSFSHEGGKPENAITLNVTKKTGSSIIDLIDDGKEKIAALSQDKFPQDLKVETTLDISKIIRHDFEQLQHDGILTIILVTIVLFLFVGLKEAFVAGLAVPLVFCATFGLMLMFGITLNFLSLFSLILSLGLLVDDAIVVVQATKQYLKTGKFTPEEAVLLVFQDYKILLATTTLTTIWAFVPLLLATGIIGQFIRSIPITVSVTLASSFFIAIIVNHPMAIILERFRVTRAYFRLFLAGILIMLIVSFIMAASGQWPLWLGIPVVGILAFAFFSLILWYRRSLKQKLMNNEDLILQELADPEKIKAKIYHHYKADDSEKSLSSKLINGVIKLDKFLPHYGKVLTGILENKLRSFIVLVLAGIIFAGALTLPASGILKSEFIPPADSEYLYINIQGPPGLITQRTQEIVDQIAAILLEEKTIKSFSQVVGAGGVNTSGDFSSASGGGGQTNRAQFAINFYVFEERPISPEVGKKEKSYEIAQRLREKIAPIQGARIEVIEESGGPPAGADFQAEIRGEDFQILEHEANRYKDLLSQIPGTINEKTSLNVSPGEFTLKLDPAAMNLRNITAVQVASALRTALSGIDVTKLLQNGEEFNVKAQFSDEAIHTLDDLKNLNLVNARGQSFPLSEIAEVQLGSSLTSINRIDQKRVIVLSASVEKPHLPAEVLAEFQKIAEKNPLPSGYEIVYGGQNETNTESVYSILRAMLVAMLLIIGTLVIQFNSFRKAVLVLATIPLALTGVFYGLTLVGFTLSFPALIGILALFGVVVKNAVILVDKINLNLKVGIPFTASIVDASKSRLEAIFLTSISTIIGMIPLTLSNETWEGLGASLIFGLATSTFLTLLVIPILFHLLMKKSYLREQRLAELKAQV